MHAPGWSLRTALGSDLPALTMLSATNRMHHARIDPSLHVGALATRRARYAELLAADNTLVLLAETTDDAAPIACFAAIFYPAGSGLPARAYIEDVFVLKRWRRQGVLAALVDVLADACRTRGIDRVEVEYLADNPEGVAAWSRLGFAPHSVRAGASLEQLGRGRSRG